LTKRESIRCFLEGRATQRGKKTKEKIEGNRFRTRVLARVRAVMFFGRGVECIRVVVSFPSPERDATPVQDTRPCPRSRSKCSSAEVLGAFVLHCSVLGATEFDFADRKKEKLSHVEEPPTSYESLASCRVAVCKVDGV